MCGLSILSCLYVFLVSGMDTSYVFEWAVCAFYLVDLLDGPDL
jgi:hypothetical protein